MGEACVWVGEVYYRLSQHDSVAFYLDESKRWPAQATTQVRRMLVEGRLANVTGRQQEAAHRFAQALARAATLSDVGLLSLAYLEQGLFLTERGQLDAARSTLALHDSLLAETDDPYGQTANLYLHGVYWVNSSQYDSATTVLTQTVRQAEKFAYTRLKADALNRLAQLYRHRGEYDQSLTLLMQSLQIYEGLQESSGVANAYLNIGSVYSYTQRYASAINHFQQAYAAFQAMQDVKGQARVLNNLGVAFDYQGLPDSALAYYERALVFKEQAGDRIGAANTRFNIGAIYLEQKSDYGKAARYLEDAHQIFLQEGSPYDRVYSFQALGRLRFFQQRFADALAWQHRAWRLAEEIGAKRQIWKMHDQLAATYKAQQRFDSAYWHMEQVANWTDTLLREENSEQVAELETRYRTQQKDDSLQLSRQKVTLLAAEAEAREATLSWQRWLSGLALAVALLLGALLALLVQAWRRQQQHEAELAQTNRSLQESNQELARQKSRIENLMREQSHRLKNHLSAVAGLLTLQSHTLVDPSARQALQESHARVEAIVLVQQMLYGKDLTHLPVDVYLTELVHHILRTYGLSEQVARLVVMPTRLPADQVLSVGLIVNELVTNAAKHAFSEVRDPALEVGLQPESAAQLRLWVRDNGPGFVPEGTEPASFGLRLVQLQTQQLEGQSRWTNGQGTCFTLEFPQYG
ncbi:tetratricopeptide repeat protein [Catalinimonas alkaloidigena]|uniref:tetratricopeptide repeat protein n=1 Tax=Catalinimonas alkaloidigena TaxID=1075417 RepID=UPI001C408DD2|nr:tetratricopeptide repeat protein [Catalinimonas alkaloidigena]